MSVSSPTDLRAIDTIRTLSMDAVQKANSGHPGTPMALAPLGWLIFNRLRRHDPAHPWWPDRDRFVLSCGHASMLQYALLHLTGYDLSLDEIRNFRQWESLTPGHPEAFHTPGVETTTGPLGQGFGNAVGMAMAERHLAERFNTDGHQIVDHCVWVIVSDGDLMEGIHAESASLAGHLKLGKLIVFWDDNSITIDGRTDLSFSEDTCKRFESYGWHVQSVEDPNDLDVLEKAAQAAKQDDRPSFIRVKTIIGYPSPGKQDTSAAHGAPLGVEEIERTKEALGWPTEAHFEVPEDVSQLADHARNRGREQWQEWESRLMAYRSAHPELGAELDRVLEGGLPDGWDRDLPTFEPDPKGVATRKASGEVLTALAERLPEMVGGSADLAGSNNSYLKGEADFRAEPNETPSRNVHWGIREHAMASACNGMALHRGVRPYAATFLIFSDYMRPAIRLAALMKQPVRYVFTHDSIGLGEDGPTHQPIEHLAALRAIPGMTLIRPADANETREAWIAATRREGPVALSLTRQALPTLDRTEYSSAEGLHRGAYVLSDADDAQLVLVATGSEVALALEAQKRLAQDGVKARVVSMPCWELFGEQDAAYQREVLPRGLAYVVVEAGTRFGWERWVGADAGFVTIEHFGASAPAGILFEKFGFSAENIVRVAREQLG